MVFSILLRMCSEGINAVGHSARQNYGKCFVPQISNSLSFTILFCNILYYKMKSYSETGPSSSISPETVKHAAICGLSAAATKSKLFADQEEREIQRLAATIINHQVCCSTKFMGVAILLC